MEERNFDFSGWATRANLRCSDGRTILKDAFKHCNGLKVPLVWNHQHNDPLNVLGHAMLENRDEGVYAYGQFNDTESGRAAKLLVEHGDVSALSIYANQLKQQGANVLHGAIREVSLVLSGANPGAFIDAVLRHSDEGDHEEADEAIIYTGEPLTLTHAEQDEETVADVFDSLSEKQKTVVYAMLSEAMGDGDDADDEGEGESAQHSATGGEETVGDVFDTLSDKQKLVVYAMLEEAMKASGTAATDDEEEEEEPTVKHNVFDQGDTDTQDVTVLSHSDMQAIFADAKRGGSLRDSAIAHGIDDIEYLFPDAKNMTTTPIMIMREQGWVGKVMSGTHHTPFSRIKSIFADLTEDDARAKGYIKGKRKVDEVFGLLKRSTTPTTIYKKQKLDRDDVVDITDFDVVAWLKSEMRMMLNEEIARAVLVGDGRLVSSDDKINEGNIRPIWKDDDLFTIKQTIAVASAATDTERIKAIIRAAIKARKDYKGSGSPTLFTTEDFLTDCLLLEDNEGRILYDSEAKLATALRVKEIVTVPVMEHLTRVNAEAKTVTLMGLIVNLEDYNIGADKGGAVNMFDDFDIDYNAQKYLIETRCSGALVKPYSAIALEVDML